MATCETNGHLWGPGGQCVMCKTPKPAEMRTSKGRLLKSLLGISKAEHLRSLANEMRLSSGILNECATLFEDVDRLLGALAECFDESEEEFSDIRDMRGRIRGELVAPARPAHEPSEDAWNECPICHVQWLGENKRHRCAIHALDEAGKLADWINQARPVVVNLMAAYERRIRTDCTTEDLAQQPWRCSEYIEAERLLAAQPVAVIELALTKSEGRT